MANPSWAPPECRRSSAHSEFVAAVLAKISDSYKLHHIYMLIIYDTHLSRNLADLFSTDPDCAVDAAKPSRAMAFAGSNLDDELDMKKLQVRILNCLLN